MLAIGFLLNSISDRSERDSQNRKSQPRRQFIHIWMEFALSFQHINCYEFPFSSIWFRSVEFICLVHFVSCGFFYAFSCVPLNLLRKYLLPVDGMWRQRWHINIDDVMSIKKKWWWRKKLLFTHTGTPMTQASKQAGEQRTLYPIHRWMNE